MNFLEAVSIDNDNLDLYIILSDVYYYLGNEEKTIKYKNKALSIEQRQK